LRLLIRQFFVVSISPFFLILNPFQTQSDEEFDNVLDKCTSKFGGCWSDFGSYK
jgi:hypothetical protein